MHLRHTQRLPQRLTHAQVAALVDETCSTTDSRGKRQAREGDVLFGSKEIRAKQTAASDGTGPARELPQAAP